MAPSAVIGYLDQEQETLPTAGTLYEAYAAGRIGDWETLKTELLQFGLFAYPDLHKPVAGLSAGQKRKLQFARLMAQQANLLLLDEPTNHVSLDVLEEFETALCDFPRPGGGGDPRPALHRAGGQSDLGAAGRATWCAIKN